jgi:4-hydroxybenzoate polyprenyltransferase
LLHAATVPLLVLFGSEFELGSLYYVGVGVFAFLVASQHVAVRRKGLGCIDQVFFTRNGLASMVFFVFVIIASVGGR